MSEVQHVGRHQVSPGPCDPQFGCPPPTEIVCLKVNKVFEECRRTLSQFVDTEIRAAGTVTDVECVSAQLVGTPTCTILSGNRVRTTFRWTVTFRWVDNTGTHTQTSAVQMEDITVRMARAGEQGLQAECDVFIECIECFLLENGDAGGSDMEVNQVTRAVIRCCVGKLVLFKLISLVQLLVPAYGYCPEPPECEEVAGECPVFVPTWPPFPPQILG